MRNLKKTPQREAVLRVMEVSRKPLTPGEILAFAKSRKGMGRLGIATVYRELQRGLADHLIQMVSIPGEPPRYEMAGHHHHHYFKCRNCEEIFNIEGPCGEVPVLLPAGFRHENHTLIYYGLCRNC